MSIKTKIKKAALDWLADLLQNYFVPREDFDRIQRARDYHIRSASNTNAALLDALHRGPMRLKVSVNQSDNETPFLNRRRLAIDFFPYPYATSKESLRGYILAITNCLMHTMKQEIMADSCIPTSIKSKINPSPEY